MSLQKLSLKQEYRSDRDNLVSEFFVPCLSNCIQFDRAIQFATTKSIDSLLVGFKNFTNNNAKIRIITGHRFRPDDLSLLSKAFHEENKEKKATEHTTNRNIEILRKLIHNHNLEIKIAIPNTDVCTTFAENIGIFKDSQGSVVAFSGTANETFSDQHFESIDVFTSWGDKSRVDTKIEDFENLWQNKTNHVSIHDFSNAEKNNFLKYLV